ncbi:MAG: glucose-6-phosphate dehydrogenase [Nitrospirota bacterium]
MAKTERDAVIATATKRNLTAQPCTLVIFGGSGDLARRKLVPAVYNLLLDGALPANWAVLGVGRQRMSDTEFRAMLREGIAKHSRQALADRRWEEDFAPRLFYLSGEIDDANTFRELKARLEKIEDQLKLPGHRIFYLAIPPTFIAPTSQGLHQAGLVQSPDNSAPFSRVIVEKPIGRDLESAREINATLSKVFDESQIFRIDHYLGKETVQNLLVLRFANGIFEPLWNHKYIDHVQITVSEEEGVGTRAAYYEEAGALRDMVQNHILQLLCLVAMEPPWSLEHDVVRNARLEVLRSLRPIAGKDVNVNTVRAQYSPAVINGEEVPGYRRETGVRPDSITETFVALKVFIDNWRWADVPFYLRTGKRMPKRTTEIAVQFKQIPQILFNADPSAPLEPNLLALRIQPEEGFSFRIISKLPGSMVRIHPVNMDFQYGTAYGAASPEAYERLLLDVMAGDATLFMRRDAVEAAWEWVTRILDGWQQHGTKWLPGYAAGSWGPVEADRMIEEDGRRWRTP